MWNLSNYLTQKLNWILLKRIVHNEMTFFGAISLSFPLLFSIHVGIPNWFSWSVYKVCKKQKTKSKTFKRLKTAWARFLSKQLCNTNNCTNNRRAITFYCYNFNIHFILLPLRLENVFYVNLHIEFFRIWKTISRSELLAFKSF